MKEVRETTADDIAEYLVKRLERAKRKEEAKTPQYGSRMDGPEKKWTGRVGMDGTLSELTDLVLEKEDLLKQILSDRRFLKGESRSVSQSEVLAAVSETKAVTSGELRRLAREIRTHQGIDCSMEKAGRRLEEVVARIHELIMDPETRSAYRKILSGKIETIRSARSIGSLERLIEQSELARMELLARRNSENMTLTAGDRETIEKYEVITHYGRQRIDVLLKDEGVYYETKRRLLLEYRRQLLSDGFVETPGVKMEMMRIISHLKLGIPVLLRGHLGAGKTEIALHVSRKFFGHQPEFISGSEEATKYDIYGRTQIGLRPEEDKVREFKMRMDDFLKMNPDATRKEIKEVERQYYQTIVVKGLTTSFFQYGPLIRAMREGRPLLIDEMDGIPHSIIMRLNHALTRRPGDSIRVQESSGEEIIVKKGFCVMATGNIKSSRYKREELDAAFLSRWWSDDIVYPPQEETYEILVASLLDKRGNMQVKDPRDLDALKRLTHAASEIQKIFSGEHLDYFGEGADAARQVPASLKKSVLSLRHLWNVVRPWKAHNFNKPLENYILDEFIKPSVAEDQVYLVQLLCRYRFFKTWKNDQFGIPSLNEGKLTAFQGKSARQATV